jgi:hypothetical protein
MRLQIAGLGRPTGLIWRIGTERPIQVVGACAAAKYKMRVRLGSSRRSWIRNRRARHSSNQGIS